MQRRTRWFLILLLAIGLVGPVRLAWSQDLEPAPDIPKDRLPVDPDDDFPPPVSSREDDSEVLPEDQLSDEIPVDDADRVDAFDPDLEQGSQGDDEVYLTEEMPREMAAAQGSACTGTPTPQRVCQSNNIPQNQTATIVPLGIYGPNHNYFYFKNQPALLVGASADNACHMALGDPNICNPGNFQQVLCDASSKGLNKIQLWIEIVGDTSNQHPFKKASDGKWVLDDRNDTYFANLRAVVDLAQRLYMAVEITFFVPWQGDFTQGPWYNGKAKLKSGSAVTGLTSSRQFTTTGNALAAYQKQVVDWTLAELWCYDNVYWQIANEPEEPGTNANTVDLWQDDLISYIRSDNGEHKYFATNRLGSYHLIAVNPFTAFPLVPTTGVPTTGVIHYAGDNRVSIINGHYTTIESPGSASPDGIARNRGAIDQIRNQNGVVKIYEFNEGEITQGVPIVNGVPAPVPGQNYNITGKSRNRYTRSRDPMTGAVVYGYPEPARAEAWEFMLSGGGSYDHYGYVYNSNPGQDIRRQLGVMKELLNTLVFSLQPSSKTAPTWLIPSNGDPNNSQMPYPTKANPGYSNGSQRFWAAMESPGYATATSNRKFLFYVHRSTFRCKASDTSDPTYNGSCPSYMTFSGYDARNTGTYQEKLKVKLGSQTGTFTAQWIDPATKAPKGSPITLSAPCPASGCSVTSLSYNYDLLLKITQN
ncbi:MAG TPA: hypothetical protein VH394_07005 [Thermoanaerobaculia bacterium]|jgi:hypothetical protein|nr:hypothetical protein [Thermoanaerobaculia bacterium]